MHFHPRTIPTPSPSYPSSKSHSLLNLRNRLPRIQPLRTRPTTIQNSMAPIQTHTIIQHSFPLLLVFIPAIRQPPITLQQHRGAEILFGVPPVGRAGGGAAGAQNAFIESVELFAVGGRLTVFAAVRGGRATLEEGFDGFVLFVELGEVGDEVFDDVGVGERVDAGLVGGVGWDAA